MSKTSILLALALFVASILPIGICAEGSTVSQVDAVKTARAALMEVCGFSEDDLLEYIMTASFENRRAKGQESSWIVSFEYNTSYSFGFMYFSVVINASDGKVKHTSDATLFTDFMNGFHNWEAMTLEQEKLERKKGPYRSWTENEKAALDAKFGDTSFAEEQQLPLPEDMQLWEAAELAKKAIMEKYGVAREEIDTLRLSGNFFAQEKPRAWTIGFSDGEEVKYTVTLTSPDGSIKSIEKSEVAKSTETADLERIIPELEGLSQEEIIQYYEALGYRVVIEPEIDGKG